jgi:hypothetical protein
LRKVVIGCQYFADVELAHQDDAGRVHVRPGMLRIGVQQLPRLLVDHWVDVGGHQIGQCADLYDSGQHPRLRYMKIT